MHVNTYISPCFFPFVCFPSFLLSLLLLRRPAIEETKTKIPAPSPTDNYLYNFYYYTVKSCQDLGACLVGFLAAFLFLKCNFTSGKQESLRRKLAGEDTFPAATLCPTTFVDLEDRGANTSQRDGGNTSQRDGWVPGSLKSYFLGGYTVTLITLAQLLKRQKTVRITFLSLQ